MMIKLNNDSNRAALIRVLVTVPPVVRGFIWEMWILFGVDPRFWCNIIVDFGVTLSSPIAHMHLCCYECFRPSHAYSVVSKHIHLKFSAVQLV